MAKQKNPNGLGHYRKLKDGRVAWRQMVDGQVREISAKTPKELQEKVKKIANLPVVKNKYKVEEWFEKWLEVYIKQLKKKATYEQYEGIYRVHIKPAIGKRKMATIEPYDIQSVIAKMNEANLSTKTMTHAKNIMNGAFKKAEEEKVIASNPVVNIEIPNKMAKPRKTLKFDEIGALLEAMKNSRWKWSVYFLLVTGLRRGELLALKWSDIDWQNKRIMIDESNSSTGLGDTKNAKIHYVPLSDNAVKYLENQKQMLELEHNPSMFNEELMKDPLVFPNESGIMIQPKSYYTLLRRFGIKAGVKVSPHMFRHTFVYLTRSNLSLKDLQNILGHSESTTTLDIYGNMINDSMDENIKQIDSVFDNVQEQIEKRKEEKVEKSNCKIIQFPKAK